MGHCLLFVYKNHLNNTVMVFIHTSVTLGGGKLPWAGLTGAWRPITADGPSHHQSHNHIHTWAGVKCLARGANDSTRSDGDSGTCRHHRPAPFCPAMLSFTIFYSCFLSASCFIHHLLPHIHFFLPVLHAALCPPLSSTTVSPLELLPDS